MAHPPTPNDVGLRLVIAYKFVKGALALSFAAVLGFGSQLGLEAALEDWTNTIHTNATQEWSVQLTEFIFSIITRPHALIVAAIALTFDGTLTTIEGWALHHRKPWGEWLVVVATSTLLPFEIYEIIKGIHLGRIAVFLINLWIVIYLARRIAHEQAARKARETAAG